MDLQRKKTKRLTYKDEYELSILNIGMQGDFCDNYLPKSNSSKHDLVSPNCEKRRHL